MGRRRQGRDAEVVRSVSVMVVVVAIATMGRGNETQTDRQRDRHASGEDAFDETETTCNNTPSIRVHRCPPFFSLTMKFASRHLPSSACRESPLVPLLLTGTPRRRKCSHRLAPGAIAGRRKAAQHGNKVDFAIVAANTRHPRGCPLRRYLGQSAVM